MSFELLKNPWINKFIELVKSAEDSIRITSPFIKENIVNILLENKRNNARIELITSVKLISFIQGSIDLKSLETLLSYGAKLSNNQSLHSKIYIFDDKRSVISSANLTNGGLIRNYEYGILINEPNIVKQVSKDYDEVVSDEKTGVISSNELNTIRSILTKLPYKDEPNYESLRFEENQDDTTFISDKNSITSSLEGWKLEIFSLLNEIEGNIFSLEDMYKFENFLKDKYPDNKNIKPKIRQQLQFLRDIGLVSFLGSGNYKKLWRH